MNSSLSLTTITAPITRFIGKYHATMFITFIGILLGVAILLLVQVSLSATDPSSEEIASSSIKPTFDEDTAKKIQELRKTDEAPSPLIFPSGRNNPFVEQ